MGECEGCLYTELRILVTGSEGFVGRHATRYLSERGHEVLRVDLKSPTFKGDILEKEFVFGELASLRFEAVVHLAAIADIRRSIEDSYKCYEVNCVGTLNMLELAARKGVDRFVYMSSANVYGIPSALPVEEDQPLNPRAPYDYSKVVGELFTKSFKEHRGVPAVRLRSWKIIGEGDVSTSAVMRFITSCLQGKPIPLYNAGRDTTDFYAVEDFCRALELTLISERAVGQVFNVGTGREVSVRQLAETIKAITSSKSVLEDLAQRTPLEGVPMRSYPSIRRIREALGYTPEVGLEEALARIVNKVREGELPPDPTASTGILS